jgi:phage gp29-like protein
MTHKDSFMPKSTTTPARPELDTEVANRLRDPFEVNYMGVLRTNDPLLLERGDGSRAFELYRDLKRDGKVFSGLQKRKLAVIGKPWQVEAVEKGAAGEKDVLIVTEMLKLINFDTLCAELLDALLLGFVPTEIVWTIRDNLVAPARVIKRAQRRFVYVQADENSAPALHLLSKSNMLTGEAVPDKKFMVHRVNPEDDNPYGTGLGLQLYWPVFFKRKGILSWNKLNDRFGSPTPWGKYPKGAGTKEKATLFDALKAMSNDGVIMTPEGMGLELLESKLTGSITTQQSLCEYMDDWIMEVILGQSPRGKGGGALAAASNEREDVRVELSQADSDLLSETLNSTLLKWFCDYNGLSPCRVYRVIKKDEDLKVASETDANVSSMGFNMTIDGVRAKYGEHWNEAPGQPVVDNKKPGAKPPVAGKDNAASFAEPVDLTPAEPDEIDALVDAELAQWRPLLEPMTTPLQAAIDAAVVNGETAADLIARLPALLAQMDADALAQALTRAAFTARLVGIAALDEATPGQA